MNIEELKLTDLLQDYCEVEGIQIVRVLNLDVFFGVLHGLTDAKEDTLLRYLDRPLIEKLKNNQLTKKELLGKGYNWSLVESVEELYTNGDIKFLVESAIEKGYDMNNLPGGMFKDNSEANKGEDDKEKNRKEKDKKGRRFNFKF